MAKKKAKKGGKKKKKKKASKKKKSLRLAVEKGDRQKEIRQEKEKGGKEEKGETCRPTGQPRRNDGTSSAVARSPPARDPR